MSREVPVYFKNFQTVVLNKDSKHEHWLKSLDSRVGRLEMDLEDIKEKVAEIPFIKNMLMDMLGNMKIDWDERTFMNNRINDHEERITKLEKSH